MNRVTGVSLLLILFLAPPLFAQDGFFRAQQSDFERAADKLVQLAEAMPADKYSWRPAEGIRSVSENFMHLAEVNFILGAALGAAPAKDASGLESLTDKERVIAELKRSISYAQEAFEEAVGSDMDREVPFFGSKRSAWSVIFVMNGHAHEHLGQAIAYARSNGVTPPWSR